MRHEKLIMGLAFDNFDELSETLTGANTLHYTMGILYQNKTPLAEYDHPTTATHITSVPRPKQIRKGRKGGYR